MKVCIIGACGHSKQAYKYLKTRSDTELCGIARGSEYEASPDSFDTSMPLYDDYTEMLDSIHPDLAIVSPVFGRTGKVIIDCAKRGINVFSEKPVASSVKELENVRRAVDDSGIRFCAMHYLRYSPAFYHAARMVKNGEIGDVKLISAQKSYKYGTRPSWYSNTELYVGTIPWVGIHAIDWIYHFSGKRFLSVASQSVGEAPEMAALCQFEMEGDAIASVNIDYYRPKGAPTHGDDRVRCVGSNGIIEVSDGKITVINERGSKTFEPREAPELLEEFIEGRVPISADEIFYLTRVSLLARDSADKKEKIMIVE